MSLVDVEPFGGLELLEFLYEKIRYKILLLSKHNDDSDDVTEMIDEIMEDIEYAYYLEATEEQMIEKDIECGGDYLSFIRAMLFRNVREKRTPLHLKTNILSIHKGRYVIKQKKRKTKRSKIH